MAQAKIITVWHDGTNAYISASVDEGDPIGVVEYNASILLSDIATLTNVQKKAALVKAVKDVRDKTLIPAKTDLSAIASGNIIV